MKQPWFAVLFSYFLPGLGHAYAGRWVRGFIFLIPFLGCFAAAVVYLLGPDKDPRVGLALFIPVMIIYVAAIVDSHRAARSAGARPIAAGEKDPWLAAFISYVLPGIALPGFGQIWGGRWVMGIVLFGIAIGISAAASLLGALLLPLHHLVRVAALWHAQWSMARTRKALSGLFLLLVPFLLAEAALVDFGIPWFSSNVVAAYVVPGSGMEPALKANELVLADRWSYRTREPRRDEVVIYQEGERGAIMFARVVALPGEEVHVAGGRILVKGKPVGRVSAPLPEGEWGSLNVPPGSYFLIADNARPDLESGLPPPVHGKWIFGRAYKRLLPLGAPPAID